MMVFYHLTISASFEKDISRLSPDIATRIVRKAKALAEEPFPSGIKKLRGEEGLYRLRVGDYRVVYTVDVSRRVVDLVYARHRKDIYRKLG